jgi:methyl-accepting chemotaxis protein
MGTYFLIRINYANKARAFSDQFQKLYIDWTTAQHAQHDFFIKYKKDPVFFQTEQSKYLKRSQIYTSDILTKLDSLSSETFIVKNGFDNNLNIFRDNVENVESIFEELVHIFFLRGSEKTGIIGDCFSFYHLASDNARDLTSNYLLSQMNSAFLRYLQNPSLQYYQDFLDRFTQLNVHISRKKFKIDTSAAVDTTNYIDSSATASSDFISNVNSYKRSFSKLVSLDRKIYLNEQSNLILSWTDANHSLGNIFNSTITSVDKFRQDIIKKVQIQIFLILFIIVLIFIILNLFLPKSVSKRIDELKNFIEPLKIGQIPEYKFEPKAFTEVIEMSDTIDQVISSLKNASDFAKEIGKGNFNYPFKPISDKDELGNALILLRDSLKKAQDEELQRREEDKIRQWTNIGIAKFSDILRQSAKDISELAIIIIKELVNYLEANQGGVFILKDDADEPILSLVASYAYSKERKKKKEFLLGEGLIGTCAVEKAPIYMTEIPEDYISITSGLGGANPRSLLIVPLLFEENVLGVIEIASFNKFEKYQIEFVERIAESIASSISITKINEKTAKLLELSKKEAEQRALKEEELRQNLEELQATQERAAQRENELNDLINLINKVAFIIELDIDGNIIKIPDRMPKFFELQRTEIIGRHLSEFDFQPNTELAQPDFWQKLLEGKEQQHLHKFVGLNKTFWINDYIVPSIDSAGNVIKFVCILFDVTEQTILQNELATQTEELKKKEQEIVEKVKELEITKNKTEELLAEIRGTMRAIDKTVLRAEYTPEGIFIDSNELHQKVLGYRKKQMQGKSILEFIDEAERETFKEFWKEIANGKAKELTVKRKNKATDTDIWLENHYTPIFVASGKISKIIYLAIDITDQKIAEERALSLLKQTQEREQRFNNLLGSLDRTILRAIYMPDGTFVESNKIHQEILGYKMEEMKGKSILEFLDENERENFKKFWKEITDGNFKRLIVKRQNKTTAKEIWLENFYNPVYNLEGKLERVLYLAIDITEHKKVEEKLNYLLSQTKQQAEQLQFLFDFSSDAIQILKNGEFVYCNDATLKLFGFNTKEEFLHLKPAEISPEYQPDGQDSMEKSQKMINKAIDEGVNEFEWVHKRKDGTNFNAIVVISAFVNDKEVYVYALVKEKA